MLAVQFGYFLILLIVLKAERTNRILKQLGKSDSGEVCKQSMVQLVYPRFQIPEDEDNVLLPKHDVVAAYIIEQQQKISEIVRQSKTVHLIYVKILITHNKSRQIGAALESFDVAEIH